MKFHKCEATRNLANLLTFLCSMTQKWGLNACLKHSDLCLTSVLAIAIAYTHEKIALMIAIILLAIAEKYYAFAQTQGPFHPGSFAQRFCCLKPKRQIVASVFPFNRQLLVVSRCILFFRLFNTPLPGRFIFHQSSSRTYFEIDDEIKKSKNR